MRNKRNEDKREEIASQGEMSLVSIRSDALKGKPQLTTLFAFNFKRDKGIHGGKSFECIA